MMTDAHKKNSTETAEEFMLETLNKWFRYKSGKLTAAQFFSEVNRVYSSCQDGAVQGLAEWRELERLERQRKRIEKWRRLHGCIIPTTFAKVNGHNIELPADMSVITENVQFIRYAGTEIHTCNKERVGVYTGPFYVQNDLQDEPVRVETLEQARELVDYWLPPKYRTLI